MSDSNTVFVGLDIDDTSFHGSVYFPESKEFENFVCKPTFGALSTKLEKFTDRELTLKICYEATHIGFTLCRDLRAAEYDCEIVSPSQIPVLPGKKVKTDRLDAQKLAEFYAKELLTIIYVPDQKDEDVRSMIRTRNFLANKWKDLKRHILSLCRVYNMNYREETQKKSYWTIFHIAWLKSKIKADPSGERKFTLEKLLYEYDQQKSMIGSFDEEISRISRTDRYKNRVEALECIRGLDTPSAMGLVCEIGDIKRFSHPKKLVSYSGMDIKEYSSGGKERKMGITKMGNHRIRTIVVEASQNAGASPSRSRRLRQAMSIQSSEITGVGEKCMRRLHKKATGMKYRNKPVNKIKTALAREMLCFVWEMLCKVS